jgi:trigger factor
VKASIKKLSNTEIEILVEVPSEDFSRYCQRTILDLGKDAEVKGFRRGHVPPNVLEKEIGQEKILAQAAQKAIEENYIKAVIDNDLEVIGKPEVEILKLASKNPLIFKAKATILPEIKLPDYKKIASSVKKKKESIKEEEVEEAIKWLQKSRAKLIALNREAQKGDFIEIEYQSSQIENGEKKKDGFILDKGHFIPGFEENCEGMKAGQEKEFFLILPQDYFIKNLAGKEVKFKVKMDSVFKMELPEADDRFAKSLGNFQDLNALKKNIKEGLEVEKERKTKEKFRGEILEKIIDLVKWEIPKGLTEAETDRLFTEFKQGFSRNPQISFKDYLNKNKKSEEEIKKSFSEPAQRNIKTFLILKEISRKEDIKTSEEEVEKEINEIFKKHPDSKTAQKDLDLERLKQYTRERITNEKTFQLLESFSGEA